MLADIVILTTFLLPIAGPAVTLLIRRKWLALWAGTLTLAYGFFIFGTEALFSTVDCSGGGCFGFGLALLYFGAVGFGFLINLPVIVYKFFDVQGYGR